MKNTIKAVLAAITIALSVNTITATEAKTQILTTDVQDSNSLQAVFDNYFALKDALIKSDAKTSSAKATTLLASIGAVKMDKLKNNEHNVWMKVMKKMTSDAKAISSNQDLKKQRETFKSLSKNTYELIKASGASQPVYYQYCPMADANWLSKEKAVKNPYYGSSMLTCGNVVETIK
ncbi:DUF3347 domain-containing protein [Flavobacterium sp. FlaQc-50]|uniref:DUF3347 domain-containing protein n=1 Tax=unclassified Flavobacterium TaxID=196869 RepID=UPI0037571E1F